MDKLEVKTDRFLPPELTLIIIQLLSHKDRQTFCLLSHSSRQLALPALFGKLVYSRYVPYHIKQINEARGDVKAAIKELVLNNGYECWDERLSWILFAFLRSLPNLQRFRWDHFITHKPWRPELVQMVNSLQHCPLEHFTYWIPYVIQDGPVTAPPRLKSLSVKSHHIRVYDFIRPSFSTLVELEISPGFAKFDLLLLRPVGKTLRKFVYKVRADPDILDTIPNVFPHLTALELVALHFTGRLRWKNSYDDAIAKNTNLQNLAVSAEDFIFCDSDPEWAHLRCRKCGDQRVQATRVLAMSCTDLKRCRWNHSHAQYCFDVRMSRNSSEGNTSVRVKRVPIAEYMADPFADCRR